MDGVTIVAGIQIPSTSLWFLGVVAVHVAMGLMCVAAGIGAMLTAKRRGRHSTLGTVYFWLLLGIFVSSTVLSILRWSEDYHLFILGALSFCAALTARNTIHGRPATRLRLQVHAVGMATSYMLLLTAFYVDNGKNLPVWKDLPPLASWLAPAIIGLPILAYVLFRHPLMRAACRRPDFARDE